MTMIDMTSDTLTYDHVGVRPRFYRAIYDPNTSNPGGSSYICFDTSEHHTKEPCIRDSIKSRYL